MTIEDEKRNFKEPQQNGQSRKSSAKAQPASDSQSRSAENASGAVLGSASDTLINGGQFMAAASVNNVTMVGCTITTEGIIPQNPTENGHPQQSTNRSRKRRRGRMRPQQDPTGHVQTSNEIYERLLREKGRGHPLWIPQPNMVLPKTYRAQGVRIGDVGIFTDDGGFDFLFNICVPIRDPINPEELPENFVSIYPSINPRIDICKFPRFSPRSYLASSSVAESRTAEQSSGLTFESSASEGAILTMPEGADSENLRNRLRFQTYIGTHAKDWYKFVNGPCGRGARNGDLRVVVGHDKSTSWGMATFSNSSMSQDTNFRLKFTALENQPSQCDAVNNYAWEYSGVAEVRVGPGPGENKGLGETDSDRLQNQCLFIRSLHVMLSEKVWREVFPQTVVVADQNDSHSGIQDQSVPCSPGSSMGYAAPQSSQLHSPQNLPSQSHNSTTSLASSDFTNFPKKYGTLNEVVPNQMESPFRDLSSYNIVDVVLASQLGAEEDTSSQISSDTSSTYEEIQCDQTPMPDVILTHPSPCNGVLHPSQIISQYLLEQVPDAIISVTHDRDWSGIIGTDSCRLDSSQLLLAVRSRNDIVLDNDTGLVFLELKERDQNGMLSEQVKVSGLIKSIKGGTFTVDQYLFGFHGDQCMRLRKLCKALRSGSTNQPISMSSFLIGHPERPLSLDEILKICTGDFQLQGRQSISSLRAELTLLPSHHADRSNCLLRLSDALSRRFSQWAQTDDLEEAISSYETLLSLIPDSHYQYLEALLGLCSSLHQRFALLDQGDDLKNLLKYLELQHSILNRRGSLLASVEVQLGKLHRNSGSTKGLESEPSAHVIEEEQIDCSDEISNAFATQSSSRCVSPSHSMLMHHSEFPEPMSAVNAFTTEFSPALRSLFSARNLYHIPDSDWILGNEYDYINQHSRGTPTIGLRNSDGDLQPPIDSKLSHPHAASDYNLAVTLQTQTENCHEEHHMPQKDSQVLNSDPNQPGFTHRQQLQLFREALSLPSEGTGPFIPQLMYKPHTTSDRRRYVEEVLLEAPIYFFVEHSNPTQCGISLHDALHSRVKNLINREQVVFEGRGPSVCIRLEWPGYRQWSRQIPTKDFRSPPGPITVAKLAKNVAKCVQRFILDRKSLPMKEESDDRWRIGDRPNDIKLEDLILVSIHHVSLGSWQPHLRLRRPQFNIPKALWIEAMDPPGKQEIIDPLVKQETADPLVKQETTDPLVKQETIDPVVKQEADLPVKQEGVWPYGPRYV